MVSNQEDKAIKNVPAILTHRGGERITVRGIKFNQATGKLPEVISHSERNFVIEHNPGENTGPLNPPVYREAETQRISRACLAVRGLVKCNGAGPNESASRA